MDNVTDASLDDELTLTFKKRELIVIFNILVSQQYRIGDARIVSPILDMIEPLVAKLSNKDIKPADAVVVDSTK